ncbi:hypothetical protein ASZ90_014123 [hydrocarbon metagenome]|uniref:Uncharacterized protein n=1 Tax=hydrocarbon metagenome TaxID=938273 RepID=A0A0W8F5P5_9ZZZZ
MRRAQVEVKVERVIFLDHRSSFVSFNKGLYKKGRSYWLIAKSNC